MSEKTGSISTAMTQISNITKDDILTLKIPKKQKAKLLNKITGRNIKDIYEELIDC